MEAKKDRKLREEEDRRDMDSFLKSAHDSRQFGSHLLDQSTINAETYRGIQSLSGQMFRSVKNIGLLRIAIAESPAVKRAVRNFRHLLHKTNVAREEMGKNGGLVVRPTWESVLKDTSVPKVTLKDRILNRTRRFRNKSSS